MKERGSSYGKVAEEQIWSGLEIILQAHGHLKPRKQKPSTKYIQYQTNKLLLIQTWYKIQAIKQLNIEQLSTQSAGKGSWFEALAIFLHVCFMQSFP